ncbi:D-alanyl-D-alanine carboxypeptidase [Sinosporangium album]|uniref:D-alanyl-D-alanine carboxypeptidase n=1 Tax=Sinosporangium album TaxID=504805 RepID=A0A1G8B1V7_9ACTN|nr:serine hydrolase domain-containing protein [Sinosporangium album]SDH27249.1 D-alanyl-D-alanine carboxypeptidase [Sinosporangium album]
MAFARPARRSLTIMGLSAALIAAAAPAAVADPVPAAAPSPAPSPESSATAAPSLDRRELRRTLDAMHTAGMYGTYSAVRDGYARWTGAAGVADVDTKRPVRSWMHHRIGSLTKTYVAVAVLQQVKKGKIELDAPIGRYLPDLVPGERGQKVTVRMLLNHTSGIQDYDHVIFNSVESLEEVRTRTFKPEELVAFGMNQPPTNEPGGLWSYSNTNYILAGLLLTKVTGIDAEDYITRHVIRPAGLHNTYFPRTPRIAGPHSKAYENLHGFFDPPRDFSVYNMSWASTAGAIVSTAEEVNRFYRLLLGGKILGQSELREMLTTVPVHDGAGNVVMDYGLGIYKQGLPCGDFWGHDGGVIGMATQTLSTPDGRRQMTIGMNLIKYQKLGPDGWPQPHPIDYALVDHLLQALCGSTGTTAKSAGQTYVPFPTERFSVKR